VRSRRFVHLGAEPRVVRVKVQVENRGAQSESVPDAAILADLVQLDVASLDVTCPAPATTLHLGKLQQLLPLTIAPRRRVQVGFDVTIDCANDDAHGKGHEDFAVSAWVDHAALGSPDAHPSDDDCPRAAAQPGDVEPFLGGAVVDKGCGGRKADHSMGAPILIDVLTTN